MESEDNSGNDITERPREREFFGFHPIAFFDDLYNAINDIACEGIDAFETQLSKKTAYKTKYKKQVKPGTDLVLQYLQQVLDTRFDQLEMYLERNVMLIPEHVKLPSEVIHKEPRFTAEMVSAKDSASRDLEEQTDKIREQIAQIELDIEKTKQHIATEERTSTLLEATFDRVNQNILRVASESDLEPSQIYLHDVLAKLLPQAKQMHDNIEDAKQEITRQNESRKMQDIWPSEPISTEDLQQMKGVL
eukprot:TRINITY_DN6678_c0_g1_i1.p1 TRINITY_DN6678_c0_g1~~TRINITY_DN6678_c0_g1_i1.p1  ORF type:complete len:248 (+),score=30.05 TRINITY_DN6678_c0_g1_i1:63-806(+)